MCLLNDLQIEDNVSKSRQYSRIHKLDGYIFSNILLELSELISTKYVGQSLNEVYTVMFDSGNGHFISRVAGLNDQSHTISRCFLCSNKHISYK